ncbi:Bem2p [Sugiyamaella lignohabitans]|uniref:Bem2p n=1 Tax=Sugiyamaella lignohabitans TaxID=796027 RepID=A0A167EVN4_9ASCO|nr:Bem2p [Sugiyamaella lignohabitans]ANB14518.1 Bem2p [Sugiyamaella lignohabitans]
MERRTQALRGGSAAGGSDGLNAAKDGWVNRHASSASATTAVAGSGSGAGISSSASSNTLVPSGSISSNLTALASGPGGSGGTNGAAVTSQVYSWRLTRAVLKNGTLLLYKPPTDLGIKSFDPSLEPAHPLSPNLSSPTSATSGGGGHKRVGSVSTATAASSSSASVSAAAAAAGSRSFHSLSYRGFDVHPDLLFDSQGKIVNGSFEAICHSILFTGDEDFATTAVLTIPLMGDVVRALEMMKEYVLSVARQAHSGGGGPNAQAIAVRVKLVIDTMLTNFKGMLLNNSIHASLQQLADSVSSYNDQISTALKLSIYQKHQRMNKMLTYTREDTEVLWSMQQKVTDSMSERLHAFLGRIDSSIGSDSISSIANLPPRQQVAHNLSGSGSGGGSGGTGGVGGGLSAQQLNIPPDLFIELTSTDFLANQISCFHLKFYKQWSPAIDISLLFKTNYSYHRYNPLVFDANNLHFLGVLLIDHLLSPKYSKLFDNSYRGRLLTHWINLGNSLKVCGDLVGWVAIVTAICSPAILRLRECWAYVPIELRENVGKDWGHELFELDRRAKMDLMSKRTFRVATEDIGVTYPKERSISFFADLTVKIDEGATSYKMCEDRVNRVRTVINSWKYFFDRIPQNDTFGLPPQPNAAVQKLLHSLLVTNYETPQLTQEEIFKLSLSVDPPKFGNYLKYHYSQQSPLMTGSFLPLIFTDTNATYKLFTKSSLISALSGVAGTGGASALSSSNKRLVRSGTTRSSDGTNASTIPTSASSNFYTHGGHSTLSTSSTLLSGGRNASTNLHRSNSFPPSNTKSSAMTTGVQDIDYFSREFVAKYASQHILMKNIRDVLNMGAKLYHINEDIVLKSLSEEYNSRPSSMIEAPSKHLSMSSRRVSTQFGSTVSPRTSVNGGTPDFSKVFESFAVSIDVVVKSANLERLVDILVLGVNGFASFVNQQDVDRQGNLPDFRIDMNVHTLTFFATFRSFCSPLELLTSLRKRFVGARSAAMSIDELTDKEREVAFDDVQFPNWDPVCEIPLDNNRAWGIVAQIQIGVLEACHLWVSQYFSDFADNVSLKEQFLELTEIFGTDIASWKGLQASSQINEDYSGYLETMEVLQKKVRNLFYKKSYRPNDVCPLIPQNPVGMRYENLPVGNTNVTFMKLEKFIDDINLVVSEYLGMVSVKEWMELFETLELQSAEINGFFHYSPPPYSSEDDFVIQDIFTYLESLYRENANGERAKTLDFFPPSIQELFRLRHNIISYLTYQIGDPLIHKDDRIQRMISILRMIGISKARMTFLDLFPKDETTDSDQLWMSQADNSGISTSVPSFIESCVIASVLRPESRLFANSWMQASREICKLYHRSSNPTSFASLEMFVPVIRGENLVFSGSKQPLSPCVGWTIERMFEIVCYVPNMSVENSSLINFDKRRFIYNLITNVSEMKGEIEDDNEDGSRVSNGSHRIQTVARRIAYIVNPDKTLYYTDKRTLKESVARDTKEYPRSYSKNKVFTSYVTLEAEKLKRDVRQRELIERQYRDVKKSLKSRYGSSSSSSGTIGSQTLSDKKSQRSRFGGLFKAVRPISMAFSGTFIPPSDRIVSVYELPDISTISDSKCKLLASINLANCDIIAVPNQHGNYGLFKVVVQDNNGSELVFQGLSDEDAAEWVRLATTGKRYATLRGQLQPSSSSSSPNAPASPVAFTRVFGVPIAVVCEREARDIPMVVDVLLNEIESRGLDEVGLYRVSGSLASVHALKAAFDSGQEVDMEDDRWFDINTVAGCFKLYLRELREPLLTTELFPEFVQCGSSGAGTEDMLKQLRVSIRKLPAPNYNLLRRLLRHLGQVAEHEANNKMKTPNLAIVFSMSFLPASAVDQMKAMQNVLNTMIIHHERLFGDDQPVEYSTEAAEITANTADLSLGETTNSHDQNHNTASDNQPDSSEPSTTHSGTENTDSQLPTGNQAGSKHDRDSFTEVSAY